MSSLLCITFGVLEGGVVVVVLGRGMGEGMGLTTGDVKRGLAISCFGVIKMRFAEELVFSLLLPGLPTTHLASNAQ